MGGAAKALGPTASAETSPPITTDLDIAGLKPDRVLPGTNGTVAVMGRSMDAAVRPYAQGLTDMGYNTEIFDGDQIPQSAKDEWTTLKDHYAPNYIPDDALQQSQMYQANQAWAQKLTDQGYTVVDMGNPTNASSSVFYNMEKQTVFGDK